MCLLPTSHRIEEAGEPESIYMMAGMDGGQRTKDRPRSEVPHPPSYRDLLRFPEEEGGRLGGEALRKRLGNGGE